METDTRMYMYMHTYRMAVTFGRELNSADSECTANMLA